MWGLGLGLRGFRECRVCSLGLATGTIRVDLRPPRMCHVVASELMRLRSARRFIVALGLRLSLKICYCYSCPLGEKGRVDQGTALSDLLLSCMTIS